MPTKSSSSSFATSSRAKTPGRAAKSTTPSAPKKKTSKSRSEEDTLEVDDAIVFSKYDDIHDAILRAPERASASAILAAVRSTNEARDAEQQAAKAAQAAMSKMVEAPPHGVWKKPPPPPRLRGAARIAAEKEALKSEENLIAFLKLHCSSPTAALAIVERAGDMAGSEAYTALVAYCSEQGSYASARTAFARMQRRGVPSTQRAYDALIFTPDMEHTWSDAASWYRAMLQAGFKPTINTLHAVAQATRKAASNESAEAAKDAVHLFYEITHGFKVQPTAVACEVFLVGALRARAPDLGMAVMRVAHKAGHAMPSNICTRLIRHLLFDQRLQDVLLVIRLAPHLTLPQPVLQELIWQLLRTHNWALVQQIIARFRPAEAPSLQLLNTMMYAAATFGKRQEVEAMLVELRSCGYTPDISTYNARLQCEVRTSNDKDAIAAIMREVQEAQLQPNVRTLFALVNGALREQSPERAFELLETLHTMPDFKTTSMTHMCGVLPQLAKAPYLQQVKRVIESLDTAYEARSMPLALQVSCIEALSNAGDAEAALQRFFGATARTPLHDAEPLYVAALHVCGRTSDLSKAVALFEERRLLTAPRRPSLRLYRAMLQACVAGGRKDLGRKYAAEVQGAFAPQLLTADIQESIKFANEDSVSEGQQTTGSTSASTTNT